MAKANVELVCSECGSKYTASKNCYSRRDADNWEAYVANQSKHLCPDCYAKAMREQRKKEEAAKAAKIAANAAKCTIKFPELVGSEKQIKWATDIRTRLIAKLSERGINWGTVETKNFGAGITAEQVKRLEAEIAKLYETSAKVWIDMRDNTVFGVCVE